MRRNVTLIDAGSCESRRLKLSVVFFASVVGLMMGSYTQAASNQVNEFAAKEFCDKAGRSSIPPSPSNPVAGSMFARSIAKVSRSAREQAIFDRAAAGNVPNFLRRFRPVELRGKRKGGGWIDAVVCVMPDYLSIGTDSDFVRVPVNGITAQRIAGALALLMPTKKLVDAIHRQSDVHLRPSPMKAGPKMTSTEYFVTHNKKISHQQRAARILPGVLVAGHKKDLVLTNQLVKRPNKVAIYGWHYPNGRAIQPLSLVHGSKYADYSHGLRLIAKTMLLNGRSISAERVLTDPNLSFLLSDEGALRKSLLRFR